MSIKLVISVLLVSSGTLAEFVLTASNPFVEQLNNATARGLFGFDVESFLKKNGYPFENHEVTTEDGYILAIHRIPYGRNASASSYDDKPKPAVLIMHGTGSSSVDFLILGPNVSLPMMLADQGYDVWLGNNRGNTWSRKHVTLDPDKNSSFWDFSFHELGVYDISSMIDYVLNNTGNEKISYIGHSQGSTQFFALAAELPIYNDKINLMMGLGPAVYCESLTNPIVQILKDQYVLVEGAAVNPAYLEVFTWAGKRTGSVAKVTIVFPSSKHFNYHGTLVETAWSVRRDGPFTRGQSIGYSNKPRHYWPNLVTDYLNLTEVLGHTFVLETALKLICKDDSDYQEVCPFVLFLLFGFDSEQFDRSMLTTMLEVFPAGLSIKGLKHYLQLVKSGYFRQFDHGVLGNLLIYNQTAPPDYDISLITAPVALYYAKNDWLVGMSDVDRLADELPNLVDKYLIEYDYFNHMDFVVAKDVASMLYLNLINKLNEVNGL